MRRYQDQIRLALLVVRELAARDGIPHLMRLTDDALMENEVGMSTSRDTKPVDDARIH